MCELCTKHGDGQVWYRNARNYAQDLLADLRRRFIEEFYRTTMTEGLTGLGRLEAIHQRKGRLPRKIVSAIVEQARDEHFGQVVTLDDVRAIVGAPPTAGLETVTREEAVAQKAAPCAPPPARSRR